MATVKEIKTDIKVQLKRIYTENECNTLSKRLFEAILNFNSTQYILYDNETLSAENIEKFNEPIRRLLNLEPIQYILGSSEFYGLEINVSPGVLIPRPETEELIEWISELVKVPAQIIDICTGSGCIALALKSIYPSANVGGWDISAEALAVAKRNSKKLALPIEFQEVDILQYQPKSSSKIDIIVSNPPYVRDSEKGMMAKNVLDFEPHLALFVDDINPLLFYKKIAEVAKCELIEGGHLFFEINEAFGKETIELLHSLGFSDIQIKTDINGKDRMAYAKNC